MAIAVPDGQRVPAMRREADAAPADSTSVAPRIVHRHDDSDVLLTSFTPLDPGTFRFAVRWPAEHALFSPVAGQPNPLLIAETVRQAGTALAHAEYEAPLDDHFLLWDLHFEVPDQVAAAGFPAPDTAVVHVREARLRGRRLTAIQIAVELYRGDALVGSGGASANCVSAAAYRRLRPGPPAGAAPAPEALPEPLAPALVGRTHQQDVLLAPSGRPGTWLLRADGSHPVIFDSQNDHVPGRGVLEAMRQAAQLTTGHAQVLAPAVRAEFRRYIELDQPCLLTATPGPALDSGQTPVEVTLTQNDELAAFGTLHIRDAGEHIPAPATDDPETEAPR